MFDTGQLWAKPIRACQEGYYGYPEECGFLNGSKDLSNSTGELKCSVSPSSKM